MCVWGGGLLVYVLGVFFLFRHVHIFVCVRVCIVDVLYDFLAFVS